MAIKNTNDRYNYIFGSTARELVEFDYSPEHFSAVPVRKKPVPEKKKERKKVPASRQKKMAEVRKKREEAAEKNRDKMKSFDWKYTMVILLSLFFIVAGALLYLHEQNVMEEKTQQVYALKEEKVKLLSRRGALQSEIDKAVNLSEIEDFARNVLKMRYPDKSRTIYYTGETEDYFRQYESVSTGN